MGYTEGQSSEQLRIRFCECIKRNDHCITVAGDGAQILGYVWAQDLGHHLRSGDSIVRLHDIWVDEHARRRGIGRALFNAVLEWTEMRRARWLQWQAGAASAGFYSALGIAPTPSQDETRPFYEIEFRTSRD
jgi:GNAT superfamily N-acetyltransferase